MGTPIGVSNIGVGTEDFEDNALVDFGTSVIHIAVSGTEDFRGNTTEAFTGTTSIDAVFHMRSATRVRTSEGFVHLAPAYLMSKRVDTVGTGDKIIAGTGTWKIWNVINRHNIFNYSDLYLFED